MKNRTYFHSGAMLLELCAAIIIFILAASVCLQVLLKANDLSDRARQLHSGIRYASSAAEVLRSADSHADAMDRLTRAYPQLEGDRIRMEDGLLTVTRQGNVYTLCWIVEGNTVYTLELDPIYREEVGP